MSFEDDDNWDEDYESPVDDDETDNVQIQEQCLTEFSSQDFIMEPLVFNTLRRYFKAGGAPEQVVELLSENYTACAQTANLIAEWLILAGTDIKNVQELVEEHLKQMILKHFDPKKADSIFSDEGETPSWLADMIEHRTWRQLFYRLAEDHPDCLMLNFTIKLISDAGYQGEITTVSTACHQIEVFSRVLRTSVKTFLETGEDAIKNNLPEFTKMLSHGEHTYLYSQVLMSVLSKEPKGGASIKRLCEELQYSAAEKGLDVVPISMALSGAAGYPRACQALSSMLGRKALNPADITLLYKMYICPDPPPVELIRAPQLLDLLVEALFRPGSRINPDHKPKYIHLLAYAASVVETWKKGVRKNIADDELQKTTQAIEKAHALCAEKKGSDLISDVAIVFQCIKFPVAAVGLLKYIDFTVSELSYFKLNTDHTPLHLVLLDEIVTCHQLLHHKVLQLLIRLFETNYEELDVLVQLELKKTILDRMVHLLSRGYAFPVINYIRECWQRQDTDVSLIRHFVIEVLDVIALPYTPELMQSLLPLIENDEITGSLKSEQENDNVSQFIAACHFGDHEVIAT